MEPDLQSVVIERILLAPSMCRPRGWRVRRRADGLELRVDRPGRHPAGGPSGRTRLLDAGVAAEFGRIAARAAGWTCRVDETLDGNGPGWSVRLLLGSPEPPTEEERRLAAPAVGPGLAEWLPPAELQRGAAACGADLDLFTRAEDRVVLAVLLAHADPVRTAGRHEPGGIGLLSTARDGPVEWFAAGRAFGWLLARAAGAGMTLTPRPELLDPPWLRAALARELQLLHHPQLVIEFDESVPTPRPGVRLGVRPAVSYPAR